MLLETREFEGYWWLPSNPEDKVFGVLVFSQKDVRLELQGSFAVDALFKSGPEPGWFKRITHRALELLRLRRTPNEATVVHGFPQVGDQPRILGLTRDRKQITLERCWGRGMTMNFPGFEIATFGADLVLDGAWYEPDEEIRFDEISVRLSDLDTWALTSGFKYQLHTDKGGKTVTGLDVSYEPPPSVQVDLDHKTSLTIEFAWTWSGFRQVTTDTHISQAASLRVCFDEPKLVDDALWYVPQLRNFLSLAVGRPIRVLHVTGFHNPPADTKPDSFTKLTPRKLPVEILYRFVGLPEEAERDLLPDEMLFHLGHARPRLQKILQTWFQRQEVLGPVLVRYFYLVHAPPPSREHEFESLVRVLEAHHRRTVGPATPDQEHQDRLERILASAPSDEDRKWLEGELEYSHEPSLARRLKDALARCPGVSRRVVGNSKARNSFVQKVVVTRNYETHLDRDKERDAATGKDLVTLVYQLRAVVEMTLLLELGFTCDDVDAIFNRPTRRYSMVEHLRR